jgi:hypothetical protein
MLTIVDVICVRTVPIGAALIEIEVWSLEPGRRSLHLLIMSTKISDCAKKASMCTKDWRRKVSKNPYQRGYNHNDQAVSIYISIITIILSL